MFKLTRLLFFPAECAASERQAVVQKLRDASAQSPAVKRFILWVVATNENAVKKYQHYGYAADGLIDHVLANKMIRA